MTTDLLETGDQIKQTLWKAVKNGNFKRMKEIFEEQKIDVDARYQGMTLLHRAILSDRAVYDQHNCEEGVEPQHAQIAKYLLEKGANPELEIVADKDNSVSEGFKGKTAFDLVRTWTKVPWVQKHGLVDRASYFYTAETIYPIFKEKYPEKFLATPLSDLASKVVPGPKTLFCAGALLATFGLFYVSRHLEVSFKEDDENGYLSDQKAIM